MWLDEVPKRYSKDWTPRVVSYRWKEGDLRIYRPKVRKDGVITMRLDGCVWLPSSERPPGWGYAAWAAFQGRKLCEEMGWVWMPQIRKAGFLLTACPESYQVCVELDLLAERGGS